MWQSLKQANLQPELKQFVIFQVFELTREQERTKQAEASKDEAQYKVYAEQQRKVSNVFMII